MKRKLGKFLVVTMSILFLVACSDGESGSKQEATDKKEDQSTSKSEQAERHIYQIGETAVITSDLYDFDYEVTVTDFTMAEEVDGVKISDYVRGLVEDDPTRFAIAEVTIKNISDEAYIPSEMFSANFSMENQKAGIVSNDEFFPEADEELAPGEEVHGHVVYTHEIDDEDVYWMKYEAMSDSEAIFELPNPAK